MSKQEEPITQIDWRVRVATTIAKDTLNEKGEVIYRKGTPVTLTTHAKYGDRDIAFSDPSATALFLNQSYKMLDDAMKIHPFLGIWPPINQRPSTRVFDYLELICASLMFAYTAIEAFTNEEIPDDFIYETEEQTELRIFSVREYTKEQIERKFSLSEKLASILPVAINASSPKGKHVWRDFVQLRRLRDRVIHLKSKDRNHSKHENPYPESIWNDLLNPNQQNYPSISRAIILHFKPEENTHWLKYCPYKG